MQLVNFSNFFYCFTVEWHTIWISWTILSNVFPNSDSKKISEGFENWQAQNSALFFQVYYQGQVFLGHLKTVISLFCLILFEFLYARGVYSWKVNLYKEKMIKFSRWLWQFRQPNKTRFFSVSGPHYRSRYRVASCVTSNYHDIGISF